MTQSARLKEALRSHLLVQFARPFEEGSVNGYILDIGPRFLLTAVVDFRRFSGFQCFRVSDIRKLETRTSRISCHSFTLFLLMLSLRCCRLWRIRRSVRC